MTPGLSRKPSVLIVEDERIVAKDLQQTLTEMGYDAFAIASSADEAIARVSERCPDIVLMDIRIKGLRDGIQTAAILKENFDVPVVYLTAHADEATIQRAKMREPHGYLLKPVKAAELRSCVEVSLFKHQMEKRLRERGRWFSTTLRSIADAVVTVDIGSRITFMNPTAEALVGLPFAEAQGKRASEVLRLVDERSLNAGETPLDAALRLLQPVEIQEASLLNVSTGAQRLIDNSAAPVIDDKLVLGAVMVFRDVTEGKKLQQRLEFADRLTSLGTMAAGTAHELNNPLAVVMGNGALVAAGLERHRADLKAGVPPQVTEQWLDETAGALRDLQSAASRMGRIVSDLRAFSHPAQEAAGLVDLAKCVEWAARSTSHEFRHRARLLTHLGTVPLVKADEGRLGQIFINLLINAAQAIPPGSADRNTVSVTTFTDDRGRAVAEVRDTGAGIPPDVLGRIFDPFFTTKDVGMGTGLGLSICHGIVNSLHGEITVESQVGQGTTFRVLLPPATAMAEAAPVLDKTHPAKRARVLVVDDEPMLLELVRRILQTENHEVVCAENGREALTLISRGEKFDAILCDLVMPNMAGMELYETLLSQDPELAQRIVFVTAGATTAKIGDFLRSVPNLLVNKPFQPKTVLDTVHQLLAAQQPESVHTNEPCLVGS